MTSCRQFGVAFFFFQRDSYFLSQKTEIKLVQSNIMHKITDIDWKIKYFLKNIVGSGERKISNLYKSIHLPNVYSVRTEMLSIC